MGRNRHGALPKITVHPRSGHARVRYNGKEIWLGKHGSHEAQQKYDQLIHEIVSNRLQLSPPPVDAPATQEQPAQKPVVKNIGVQVVTLAPRTQPTAITVAEMCSRFFVYAEKEYRRPNGTHTGTLGDIKTAIRALRQFDDMSAASFGPVLLEELMHALASEKVRCVKNGGKVDYRPRKTINRTIKTIRMIFGWAVTRELIPPEKYVAMKSMKLLKAYRTNARELKKVQHVPDAVIAQTLPHLPKVVSDMVRFQRLTGVRPGELCSLRPEDVDRSETTWLWRVSHHKNAWRDHTREIHIGPKGRAILEPYLDRPPHQNCFLSSESELIRNRERRSKRASQMTPSQRARRNKSARKYRKVTAYTRDSYRRAISRACEKNNIPAWSPNQLRHTAATASMKQGHKKPWPYVQSNGEVVWMRATTEIAWAAFLDSQNREWEYEPKVFTLANGLRYVPDFYLPAENIWFEVKYDLDDPRGRDRTEKAGIFAQTHSLKIIDLPHIEACTGKKYRDLLKIAHNIRDKYNHDKFLGI